MKVPQRLLAVGSVLTVGAMVATGAFAAGASASAPVAASPTDPVKAAVERAAAVVASRPAYLHASPNEAFVQSSVNGSGSLHYVAYDRLYKGIPVVGGDFVLVTDKSGQVVSNSVAQENTIGELSVTPKLTSGAAAAIARGQLKKADKVESTTLVVYNLGRTPRLAWHSIVTGTGAEGASRLSVYVDALSGAVLGTQEHVLKGTGTGAWEGSVTISTTLSGSTYSMTHSSVSNMPCQNASGNSTFTGSDDVWGNGDGTNRETGCVDAFYGAQRENAMLSSWLGRSGMNGSGGAWPIRVGLADVNAYYDGTQVQVGHNNANQWIGSIDVIAHEMGHGVDDTTPGGISGSGTQEFVADTFGAATEAFANNPNDPPDFLVGEEVNLVGSGPIRNMYNPSALGDPNCYSSSIPSTEVHAAAGPGNHWFYLLSQGNNPPGGPTSPICSGGPSSVTGVGIQNAIKIMYNAMLMKTSSSSYLKYRTWTLTAAKNLTPGDCTLFNSTKDAWNAVSVPAQSGDPTCSTSGLTLNNPGSQTGTVGVATSLQLVASGGTTPYTFSATGLPAGLSINSSTGLISGTPTTAATYTVTATVTGGGTASQTFSWTINPAGSCSSPGQKIGNPGFESGTSPWTSTSGVIGAFSGQSPHGGTRFAWLDGYGTTHTDTLAQSVTLPSGCSNYTLTFWLHIDSSETTTSVAYDKLVLKVGSTTLATYSNLNKASGYSQKTFNLSAYAGQTINLNFTGTEDVSLQTSFVLDDFALNVS